MISVADPRTGRRSGKSAGATAAPKGASKAELRAAKKAERARRKASTDPRDMGRFRQIGRAYSLTHEYDKPLPYLMLAAFGLPIILGVVIGLLVDHPIYFTLLAVMLGVLLALIVLVRRTKKATYKRYAGQAGSAEVALQMLPKQWVSTPVIAANKQRDVIHRTVGPGGLVLIGEGEPGRLRPMLANEVRKHERVAYGVKVTTLVMGEGSGQVPLSRLAEHIRKLPKTLQPNQVTDLRQRLRALDAVRPPVPVPRGPMPTSPRQIKGSRQAMRGR
ncbi:MAG: DUF4191 domain-containing protein [Actinomycetes bacterium]